MGVLKTTLVSQRGPWGPGIQIIVSLLELADSGIGETTVKLPSSSKPYSQELPNKRNMMIIQRKLLFVAQNTCVAFLMNSTHCVYVCRFKNGKAA